MKALLDGLLPRLFPSLRFLCLSHEGSDDLERSIQRKLQVWREPGVRFAVVRDNDRGDCEARKQRLRDLCGAAGRDDTLVRIVCQELEAWYLGEPDALAEAFQRESLRGVQRRARYRDSDAVPHPARAVARLVPAFQKVSGARRMARHLSRQRNRSTSFHAFMRGIDTVLAEMGDSERSSDRRRRD